MSLIEKKTLYNLKLSPSLTQYQTFFQSGTGEFTEKTLCEFYRALNSYALEIAKAIGKIETPPPAPTTIIRVKNPNMGKMRNSVLFYINSNNKAVTAEEIMGDLSYKNCALNRTRLTQALEELARERKIDVIKMPGELTRFQRRQEAIIVAP